MDNQKRLFLFLGIGIALALPTFFTLRYLSQKDAVVLEPIKPFPLALTHTATGTMATPTPATVLENTPTLLGTTSSSTSSNILEESQPTATPSIVRVEEGEYMGQAALFVHGKHFTEETSLLIGGREYLPIFDSRERLVLGANLRRDFFVPSGEMEIQAFNHLGVSERFSYHFRADQTPVIYQSDLNIWKEGDYAFLSGSGFIRGVTEILSGNTVIKPEYIDANGSSLVFRVGKELEGTLDQKMDGMSTYLLELRARNGTAESKKATGVLVRPEKSVPYTLSRMSTYEVFPGGVVEVVGTGFSYFAKGRVEAVLLLEKGLERLDAPNIIITNDKITYRASNDIKPGMLVFRFLGPENAATYENALSVRIRVKSKAEQMGIPELRLLGDVAEEFPAGYVLALSGTNLKSVSQIKFDGASVPVKSEHIVNGFLLFSIPHTATHGEHTLVAVAENGKESVPLRIRVGVNIPPQISLTPEDTDIAERARKDGAIAVRARNTYMTTAYYLDGKKGFAHSVSLPDKDITLRFDKVTPGKHQLHAVNQFGASNILSVDWKK